MGDKLNTKFLSQNVLNTLEMVMESIAVKEGLNKNFSPFFGFATFSFFYLNFFAGWILLT
jgi:hypothetical protein